MYASTDTDWWQETFCDSWTLRNNSPIFPQKWESVSWYCDWSNWWTNSLCTASRLDDPINWVCWTANWKIYTWDNPSFWSDTSCSSWYSNPSPVNYPNALNNPAPSNTVNWTCYWYYWWSSESCSASRESIPVPLPPVVNWTSNITRTSIQWNWVLEPDVDYYEFFDFTDWTWKQLTDNYVDEINLYCSSTISWRKVRACNSYWCGNISTFNSASTLDCPPPTPAAPNVISDESIQWNWINDVVWITHYELKFYPDGERYSSEWWDNQNAVILEWWDPDYLWLNCWTTYTTQIRSCSPWWCWPEVTLWPATTLPCTFQNWSSCSDQSLIRYCFGYCYNTNWENSSLCEFVDPPQAPFYWYVTNPELPFRVVACDWKNQEDQWLNILPEWTCD